MSKITRFIIVRHGESLGNKNKLLLGHTDLDMSELGYEQARATAKYLKDERIDAIYSSDLIRAMNTAAPHAALRALFVIGDPELREVQLGDWEGRSLDYVLENYRDMYNLYKTRDFGVFTYPCGENIQSAGERFESALIRIARENEGKTVLIASHAAVIRIFYSRLLGISPRSVATELPFPTNASLSLVSFDGDSFTPLAYSLDGHLSSVGITRVN